MAEALLKHEAPGDLDARGSFRTAERITPLFAAADRGHAAFAKLLLQAGADARLARSGDGTRCLDAARLAVVSCDD